VRLLGILALAAGIAVSAYSTVAAFRARRPADLAWALVAPIAVLLAFVGLVTVVSPSLLAD